MKAQILMPKEREELRMIARLQTMNIYPQLVRMLTEGQSAARVGRWAMEQRVEGAPGAWGLGMWLRHTQALRRNVVAAKERLRYEEHRRRLTVAPVPPDPDAVLAKVDAMVEDKSLMDFIPKEARQVLKHVMGEEKEIRAIHALQIAAIAGIDRLTKTKKLDESMPVALIPGGDKEVDNMRKIGEALLRHEVVIGWARGRRNQLPIPLPENEAGEPSELAKTMMEFDDVDRNIVRELSIRFIDMVREKRSGRFEAVGLESDAHGERRADVETDSGTHKPSDAEGA